MRTETPYCDIVGFDASPFEQFLPSPYRRLHIYRYEVIDQRALDEKNIPPWARSQGGKSWRPGDVALLLRWQGCAPDDDCVIRTRNDPGKRFGEGCRNLDRCGFAPDRTYVFRPQTGRWRYVDDHDDYETLDYGDLWKRK